MIEMIEQHQNYGPAMKAAAADQQQLVLNYHTHGGPSGYCVSICAKEENPLQILGQAETLNELVHITGVSQEEGHIETLMPELAMELLGHYQLEKSLFIYVQ